MKKISEGVYVRELAEGGTELHLDLGELLRSSGAADRPENRDMLVRAALDLAREQMPGVPVVIDIRKKAGPAE